jgi:hypothetical protein
MWVMWTITLDFKVFCSITHKVTYNYNYKPKIDLN